MLSGKYISGTSSARDMVYSMIAQTIKTQLLSFSRSYSELFFIRSRWTGLLIVGVSIPLTILKSENYLSPINDDACNEAPNKK